MDCECERMTRQIIQRVRSCSLSPPNMLSNSSISSDGLSSNCLLPLMQQHGVSSNTLYYFYILTNCCNFSPVVSNHLNHPNASSNSLSYIFICLRLVSSHMSPPTDRGTSRSSSMDELAGCLFQSIIKFILIFSPLIDTLFFTKYQITLCVIQMELLPCILHYVKNIFPSMD